MQAREAEAVFRHIDKNGDGNLDSFELSCRLSDFGARLLYPHPAAVQSFWSDVR
eukprot:SAG11_NODE_38475_length_252_cov_0.679739_1_plen_54_part_01